MAGLAGLAALVVAVPGLATGLVQLEVTVPAVLLALGLGVLGAVLVEVAHRLSHASATS